MNIEKGVEEFTSGCEHGRRGGAFFLIHPCILSLITSKYCFYQVKHKIKKEKLSKTDNKIYQ